MVSRIKTFEKIIFLGLCGVESLSLEKTLGQKNSFYCTDSSRKEVSSYGGINHLIRIINNREVVCLSPAEINGYTLRKLREEFKNALFVLNTQNILDWVLTQMKYKIYSHDKIGDMSILNEDLVDTMINYRNDLYENIQLKLGGFQNFYVHNVYEKNFFHILDTKIKKDIKFKYLISAKEDLQPVSSEDLIKIQNLKQYILSKYGDLSYSDLTTNSEINNALEKFKINNNERKQKNKNINNKLYKIVRDKREIYGFFAFCSIHLFQIIEGINKKADLDKIKFKTNNMYTEIRGLYFQKKEKDLQDLSDKKITYHIFSNNIFYQKEDKSQYKEIIDNYFKVSTEIEVLKKYFITELNINPSKCISVYYRGTDTTRDRRPTYYNIFVENLKKIINQNNDIKEIFVQTDDAMFEDFINTSDLNVKIINNGFLKPVYSHIGQHFLSGGNKATHIQKMLASVILMSECQYVLCNTSNVSRWIHFYRGLNSGFYQMMGNKIYPEV
jgi:hypothetical protein